MSGIVAISVAIRANRFLTSQSIRQTKRQLQHLRTGNGANKMFHSRSSHGHDIQVKACCPIGGGAFRVTGELTLTYIERSTTNDQLRLTPDLCTVRRWCIPKRRKRYSSSSGWVTPQCVREREARGIIWVERCRAKDFSELFTAVSPWIARVR